MAHLPDAIYMRTCLAFLMLSTAVMADQCHDLWFTRNLVMDRAGYCFGSVLGQAQFDNSDCLGKSVRLSREWEAFVGSIQALERQWGCRVDTSQPYLALPDAHLRRGLETLPIADEFESACIGWRAAPTPLYAGTSLQSRITGYIQPGETLGFGHYPVGEWGYVTVSGPDWVPRIAGWHKGVVPEAYCTQWAG